MSEQLLGRIEPEPKHFESLLATGVMRSAPMISRTIPNESLPIWKFRCPRPRNQLIGCCVGESGASMAETTTRTPENFNENTRPVFGKWFSALWVYWLARNESRDRGVKIIGDGAIVSHAAIAMEKHGFLEYHFWPSTKENYDRYREEEHQNKKEAFRLSKFYFPAKRGMALINSFDQMLMWMADGYSIWVGMPWPQNWMTTFRNGILATASNTTIGGHAVEFLGFNDNYVAIGNSWANWGANYDTTTRTSNIGWARMSDIKKIFNDSAFASGKVEAAVICEVKS